MSERVGGRGSRVEGHGSVEGQKNADEVKK